MQIYAQLADEAGITGISVMRFVMVYNGNRNKPTRISIISP